MTLLSRSSPENFPNVTRHAYEGCPADVIDCALARADAVLVMLSGQFDGANEERLADSVISIVISAIQGEIRHVKEMLTLSGLTAIRPHSSPTHEA